MDQQFFCILDCQNPNATSTQWSENNFTLPPRETQYQQYISCYWPEFDQTFWTQFLEAFFWTTHLLTQIFFGPTIFWSNFFLVKFVYQKFSVFKIPWNRNFFGSNYFDQKFFWPYSFQHKFFWSRDSLVPKSFGPNIFQPKFFEPNIFWT